MQKQPQVLRLGRHGDLVQDDSFIQVRIRRYRWATSEMFARLVEE